MTIENQPPVRIDEDKKPDPTADKKPPRLREEFRDQLHAVCPLTEELLRDLNHE